MEVRPYPRAPSVALSEPQPLHPSHGILNPCLRVGRGETRRGARRGCVGCTQGGWHSPRGMGWLRVQSSERALHLCLGPLTGRLSQGTTAKVSTPSLSLPPASSRTAARPTTTTSWSISSCKWPARSVPAADTSRSLCQWAGPGYKNHIGWGLCLAPGRG